MLPPEFVETAKAQSLASQSRHAATALLTNRGTEPNFLEHQANAALFHHGDSPLCQDRAESWSRSSVAEVTFYSNLYKKKSWLEHNFSAIRVTFPCVMS